MYKGGKRLVNYLGLVKKHEIVVESLCQSLLHIWSNFYKQLKCLLKFETIRNKYAILNFSIENIEVIKDNYWQLVLISNSN